LKPFTPSSAIPRRCNLNPTALAMVTLVAQAATTLLFLAAPAAALAEEGLREPTDWRYDGASGSSARTKAAFSAKEQVVKQLFKKAGAAFPPKALLMRVYKAERRVEVWASSSRNKAYKLVAKYEICSASGVLGPKRKEGDMQVPEGFYIIDSVNPHSNFYLSLHVNYPNASDRILSNEKRPGSAIMIHGNCVSAGCLAMSDERIQEIWVMTQKVREAKGPVDVHIFPSADWATVLKSKHYTSHKDFWINLKEGHDIFEKTLIPARYTVDKKGKYVFTK